MGMILRIASSRIVGQGDIVGRSGYFSLNLSANSVMRGRLDARRTLKSLVADLRNNNRKSTFWLYERKYLRLRNVEVSYDFPQTWTRKFFVSNLRLGFVGQNLLTWAPFKMWDPEGTREDGSNYPINKTFSCYLQISF